MKILFVQTGGSIDKTYPKIRGYKFEIDEPAVKNILKKVRPNFEYEISTVLRKDSRDMTDEDRQKVYDFCKDCDCDKIIITHGTDSMVQTAKKLGSLKEKLIILTGAMLPEKFSDSDAMLSGSRLYDPETDEVYEVTPEFFDYYTVHSDEFEMNYLQELSADEWSYAPLNGGAYIY